MDEPIVKRAIAGRYGTGSTDFDCGKIDGGTNVIVYISFSHYMVHAGNHFIYTDHVVLGAAGTQDYLITTPDTSTWAHMTFHLYGSAITQWELYEGSDKTGTTLQTTGNSNRNSSNTSVLTIHKGTSGGTTDGTKLHIFKGGSATNQSQSDTFSGNGEEIILLQGTKYILRTTSSTADNLTNVRLEWYEHENVR